MKRSQMLILTLALAAAPPCGSAGAQEQTLPPILQDVRIEQHLDRQVPLDLPFRDEEGRNVRLGDYFHGKPVILVLAYYRCPKLCTLVLNGVRDSLQRVDGLEIGEDFEVVTVSFDPRETPELAAAKKQNYVASFGRPGAEKGWHFLTGPKESIDPVTEAAGFYYAYDAKTDQFAHASAIMFLTQDGRISRYLYGVSYLPRDVRLGLVEASQNKIGTPVDQVLLYCFHYDPERGKYTASVMNLVRIAGGLTLAAMGALGLVLWRHERRRRRIPDEP